MSDNGLGHILPKSLYRKVFIALIVLTIVTVVLAKFSIFKIENGTISIIVAMAIASVKASIVALFFMHLKYENPLTWVYAFFPVFLLFLLMAGIFIDNPFRDVPVLPF